jgi:hypothetical protein
VRGEHGARSTVPDDQIDIEQQVVQWRVNDYPHPFRHHAEQRVLLGRHRGEDVHVQWADRVENRGEQEPRWPRTIRPASTSGPTTVAGRPVRMISSRSRGWLATSTS